MQMHLTVVAKAPVAGRVKTRLTPPCTPEQAASVAAAALADTFAAVDELALAQMHKVLLLDGDPQPWFPADYEVVAQRGAGLGERLANGFADLGPGVVVGMETPHAVVHLVDAFDTLRVGTDVLGPADDGGYWAIGLADSARDWPSFAAQAFEGVPMSRADTGDAQLRRLHELGRHVRLLPAARDLDTYDDLRAVADSDRGGALGEIARRLVGQLG